MLSLLLLTAALSGCPGGDKRIIRTGHNQAADHPANIALLAFEEYIESKLDDKYDVYFYSA